MTDRQTLGASLRDRAGGLRPEPVAQSQPKALIPCAVLTPNELLALKAWVGTCEDFDYLNFADVAANSDLAKHLVRRTVRAMARKGVTQFCSGLSNDDGDFKGSGYGLTEVGRNLLLKHYERECDEVWW